MWVSSELDGGGGERAGGMRGDLLVGGCSTVCALSLPPHPTPSVLVTPLPAGAWLPLRLPDYLPLNLNRASPLLFDCSRLFPDCRCPWSSVFHPSPLCPSDPYLRPANPTPFVIHGFALLQLCTSLGSGSSSSSTRSTQQQLLPS